LITGTIDYGNYRLPNLSITGTIDYEPIDYGNYRLVELSISGTIDYWTYRLQELPINPSL